MDQRIIDLYDAYTHSRISRRDFMDRATAIMGSAAAASSMLAALKSDPAKAETVPANDPRLVTETVSYDAGGTKISGQLVRLKEKGKRPAVIVIHENRGLVPHIQDVARRIALEGFLTLAVDMLTPYGGTPNDEDKARELFAASIKPDETATRIAASVPFLEKHAESTGKVGAVGFCWGGGMVDRVAMLSPDLAAAVAYYGPIPPLDKVAAIKAPLLLHYAGLDTNVNPKIPEFEAALKANNKKYTLYMYENVNHAFNNDTAGPRYNKEAADLAWGRTIAFLKEHLGTPPRS
ncbi:MAG TPA: dienelactone hydrolase family protein [Pseudorhodoplanes sp.]|jgi:carboxymethylenebutenolidase|nr:dienelactone hydrolase family protein [Pseudorhodoplanes sp.]